MKGRAIERPRLEPSLRRNPDHPACSRKTSLVHDLVAQDGFDKSELGNVRHALTA
jgi:hypothetical protein